MLDPVIWRNLPNEIVLYIVSLSEASIDTRLYFRIKPNKIDKERALRLWSMLKSHDGIIYNLESQSLHIFRIPGHHIVRRPLILNSMDRWMTILNEDCHRHTIEDNGAIVGTSRIIWCTENRVLLTTSSCSRPSIW